MREKGCGGEHGKGIRCSGKTSWKRTDIGIVSPLGPARDMGWGDTQKSFVGDSS